MQKIKSVKKVGQRPVYDISVADAEHYALENGAVTHNTGGMYSSNSVWIIGRQQDKDGTDVVGWNFIINIEKSRFVKEKSKIPITVNYKEGIDKNSGLFDIALELSYIVSPSKGWYSTIDFKTGEISDNKVRRAELEKNDAFWVALLKDDGFKQTIKNRFQFGKEDEASQEEFVDEE